MKADDPARGVLVFLLLTAACGLAGPGWSQQQPYTVDATAGELKVVVTGVDGKQVDAFALKAKSTQSVARF